MTNTRCLDFNKHFPFTRTLYFDCFDSQRLTRLVGDRSATCDHVVLLISNLCCYLHLIVPPALIHRTIQSKSPVDLSGFEA